MTTKCKRCGKRTTGCTGYCQTCRAEIRQAFKRVEARGIRIDAADGAWWAWDQAGNVLAGPCKNSNLQILVALGEFNA